MKSSIQLKTILLTLLSVLYSIPQMHAQSPDDPDRVIIIIDGGQRIDPGPLSNYLSGQAFVQTEPPCLATNLGDETLDLFDSLYVEILDLGQVEHFRIKYAIRDANNALVDISSPEGIANPFILNYNFKSGASSTPFSLDSGGGTEPWYIFETKVPYTITLPAGFEDGDKLQFRIVVQGKGTTGPWQEVNSLEFESEVCFDNGERRADPNTGVSQLQISPNPFQQMLSMEWLQGSPEQAEICLVDAQGRLVLQKLWNMQEGSQFSYRTGHLPAGFYVLQVKTKSHQVNYKLIKAN